MIRRALATFLAALVLLNVAPVAAALAVTPPVPAIELQPITSVLWMGDSMAYELSPGVETALEAAGMDVSVYAYPGISITGDDWLPPHETWLYDHHEPLLAGTFADVVIWELSLFDTLSPSDVLLLGYRTFVDMALRNHLAVVFVLPPPLRDGAVPFGPGFDTLINVAYAVAARYPGKVIIADAVTVWGTTFVAETPDGTPLRKPDGVHVCPMAAVLFGDFLVKWLSDHFAGLQPTDMSTWPLDWWTDERYDKPVGACADRASSV